MTTTETPASPANPAGTHDVNAIMALLPHRYPFLLIDRVMEVEARVRIVARKCVTINESYFQGHFPGYPIMPGVMQVEAIAQAAGIMVFVEDRFASDNLMFFTSVERARFRRPIVPGDVMEIEVKALNLRTRAARFSGIIRVDGRVVCEAVITCHIVKRSSVSSADPAAAPAPSSSSEVSMKRVVPQTQLVAAE
jgi:3-hydroxyacyl-[acyl-carrier-protein] dehydratase